MSLNFNVGPYFDDFDPSKNFHRILFKPGSAVQARELTQSQTILQNQISEFASSIFTQNTPVAGGQVTTNLGCYYVKLNATNSLGQTVTASSFNNQIIQDTTGTILARVIATIETTSSGSSIGDPATLIVTYLSGPQFSPGDYISTTSGITYLATVAAAVTYTSNNTTITVPPTGLSSTASIANGAFYIVNGYSESDSTQQTYSIGNFVDVLPQTIVLDKYDNVPSARIGLQITETIVDYIDDTSLLDPAIGASNYQAPGADRYSITLQLISLPLGIGQDQSFIELVRIENGEVVKHVDGTVYSTLDDYFAKRDYETNGDYIVYDFTVTPNANSNTAINQSNYNLGISKGVAYVHGYRVENQSQLTLTNSRAQTTANISSNSLQTGYGNYFIVDTASGVFDVTTMPQVDLHCVPAANISTTNVATYSSTLVGTSFIRNLSYLSGTGTTTKSYVYNAYISDLNTVTLAGNVTSGTANTVTISDVNGKFSASANAYYHVTVSVTTGSITDTRNIISYTVAPKVFTVDTNFTVAPTASSTFTFLFQPDDVEAIVKNSNNTIGTIGSGTYTSTANVNINTASGKELGLAVGDTLLVSPGAPELVFPLGYPYLSQVTNSIYSSNRIFRNKTFSGAGQLQLSASENYSSSYTKFLASSGALSSSAALTNFIVVNTTTGNILDFSTAGNTITVSSDRALANLSSVTYANMPVAVIAGVQVVTPTGTDSSPILKAKNLVTGNTTYISSSLVQVGSTGTYQDLAKAQVLVPKSSISGGNKSSLYVTDVKNISKIIDLGSITVSPSGATSTYTNITNYFKVNNGQTDSYYDHASITLVPGAPSPVGNILVIFNYYSHTTSAGDGFFSIQSYANTTSNFGGGTGISSSPEVYAQIPTYTDAAGDVYKLSDCVDFRPSRVNGQTSYIWEYSQTQSSTNDIGILIPQNLSNYLSDYYYYLARKDLLALTKDKSFKIIQGTPSVNPVFPTAPDGSLILANLSHDPYTAYVPGENPPGVTPNLSVNKVVHKRWAKSDITELETRVNNLEYYTSLSMLERNAQSQSVPDQFGVARPNYGILVDDFSSFSSADTTNSDYLANISVRQNRMSALQIIDNFQLQNPAVLASLGTLANTSSYAVSSISGTQSNLFTLPYTTSNVVVQSLASSAVSVNPFSVMIQQGRAQLNPPMDNWIDNTQSPSILVTETSQQIYQQDGGVSLVNAGDMQTLVATKTFVTPPRSTTMGVTGGSITSATQQYYSQTGTSPTSGVSSALTINNGYITNSAVLPYIRPQQIIVRASGLLVNTPISVHFDGINVGRYITNPNTIELSGVSGTFKQDDIVGFYLSSTAPYFFPVARVVSVYNYPDTTKTRLYVADLLLSTLNYASTTLQNALFDQNGTYLSSTASGTVPSSGILSINSSGPIGGIGQTFTSTANTSVLGSLITAPDNVEYCSFLNTHGVWGDSVYGATYAASFPFTAPVAGTYTFKCSVDNNAVINIDDVYAFQVGTGSGDETLTNVSTEHNYTTTLTAGLHKIGWVAHNVSGPAAFALVIYDPTNAIQFDTIAPATISYNNVTSTTNLPDGGTWVTGVNNVYLPTNASSVNGFYNNSTITFYSKYVYGITTPEAFNSSGSTAVNNPGTVYGVRYSYNEEGPVLIPEFVGSSGGGGGGWTGKMIDVNMNSA